MSDHMRNYVDAVRRDHKSCFTCKHHYSMHVWNPEEDEVFGPGRCRAENCTCQKWVSRKKMTEAQRNKDFQAYLEREREGYKLKLIWDCACGYQNNTSCCTKCGAAK